jgi:hypothetical protein
MSWPHPLILLPARLALRALAILLLAGCLPGMSLEAEDVVFYVVPGSKG